MQVQKSINNSDERFLITFKEALEQMYRKQLSEAIKRGIKAKKLQKEL